MGRKPLVSRESALDGVMRQFWSTGYAASSLEELLAASGLHRGSFYREFGDKRGAFEAALGRYGDLIRSKDLAPSVTSSGSPTERLIRLLYARIDTVLGISRTFTRSSSKRLGDKQKAADKGMRPGCLVVNTALELAPHDDALLAGVALAFDSVRGVIAGLILGAVELGEADPGLDVDAAATQVFTLLMGATVLAAAGTQRDELRRVLAGGVRSTLQRPTIEGRSE
jgi:TetR/AcrR family transcriptional repressor of nem operon